MTEEIWECNRLEENYPKRLQVYENMPQTIYIKGRLPLENVKTVAIVGARICSHYGAYQAYRFAKELAQEGVQIISGMAKGIDTNAHKGALDAGGTTYAILGSGVDVCYPKQNQRLYEEIITKGGVLSEFENQTPPFAGNFPRRNRIISGLADLILVVEAKKKSGSLITANYALEQGKTVFAVPGRVDDALSEGCNMLIADGAGIANSVESILSELQILPKKKGDFPYKSKIWLASHEEMVYSCLDLQPKNIEEIFQKVPLKLGEIQEILLKLELEGLIMEPVKNYYTRTGG